MPKKYYLFAGFDEVYDTFHQRPILLQTFSQRDNLLESLPYAHFLGYEKGEDGFPKIIPAEAETVRLIFRLYMEGKTFSAIAKYLEQHDIPSPAGKKKWQARVVQSILTNEKYKGHALMQKTYCANFLTKKMVKNTGQVQQYYVEDSHPAIIEPDDFDAIQLEIERRKSLGRPTSTTSIFASRLVCADCGGHFGKKVWGSYKSDKTYRKEVWGVMTSIKGSASPAMVAKRPTSPRMRLKPVSSLLSIS